MMTERDYIAVHDLATIRAVDKVLRDIMPGASNGLIPVEEYRQVLQIIGGWRIKHEQHVGKSIKS
jgi:hypothetical protein